jgi:hypothetical protein
MTTLLDSRVHHRRIRILSRKAQESIVLNEEPSKRKSPVMSRVSVATKNIGDQLTARQRSQRQRRQREANIQKALKTVIQHEVSPDRQIPVLPPYSPDMEDSGIQPTIQQQSQRQRRLKERCTTIQASRKVSVLLTPCLQAC